MRHPAPHSPAPTVAAAQYRVEPPADWSAFEERMRRTVEEAVSRGARLLVFPEYGGMELAALISRTSRRGTAAQFAGLQAFVSDYTALFRGLAAADGIYILAGSLPVRGDDGRFRNRAYLFSPRGRAGYQDKLVLTPFERTWKTLVPGSGLRVFHTELGKIAVNICYDAEFPGFARAQAVAGATLLLVPSCTDSMAGLERVRTAGRARAMENQCYVIHAVTCGGFPGNTMLDVNVGRAAVYAPMDHGFPSDGVLAEAHDETDAWVTAALDPAVLRRVRRSGQVRHHRDWPDEAGWRGVQTVDLRAPAPAADGG